MGGGGVGPHLLVHVSVHGGDSEVPLVHLLSQPVHLPPRVTEDHSLRIICKF